MKLPFDENLSPRLPSLLADVFPSSTHVHYCGLGSSDDGAVWQYAKENDFTIVSKDSDFQERSVLYSFPPKFIWIRVSNCTSVTIDSLLRAAPSVIREFERDEQESCLVLSPESK